jgi:hypothetical protein
MSASLMMYASMASIDATSRRRATMRKKVLASASAAALMAAVFVPLFGGDAASAHERCVTLEGLPSEGAVVQMIANGQAEDDPAGYSTNPQGHDRGIRNARDHSPAIASCPED